MRLVEIIEHIKAAATECNLFTEIKLIKSDEDIDRVIHEANYRSLLISVTNANIFTEDDGYVVQLLILDKVADLDTEDDSYMYSLNDAVTAIRTISDRLNYNATYMGDGSGGAKISPINFTTGRSDNKQELITMAEATLTYSFDIIPNIDIG